jgi:hypothetical protein
MKATFVYFRAYQELKSILHFNTIQPFLTNKDSASVTVVLVTCLLFIILEYFRDQARAAAMHLQNGLRLLRDMHSAAAKSSHGVLIIRPDSYRQSVDLAILQGFASLHVQANLFGNHIPDAALILQVTETEMPSPLFASLEEARNSLDKLLHGILLMSQRAREALCSSQDYPLSLFEAQGIALSHLETWQHTYNNTLSGLTPLHPRQLLAYQLLLNYHTMASIMSRSMHSISESIYNEYTNDFIFIIKCSIALWKHYLHMQNTDMTSPTIDMGWIPPLYFTALKCRISRLRSHAIKLLRSVPHKEGVWDSAVVAHVAEKVQKLEEQSIGGNIAYEDSFSLDQLPSLMSWEYVPVLPDEDLFHEVEVDLSDTENITLTCKRGLDFGTLRTSRYNFDGKDWQNLGTTLA